MKDLAVHPAFLYNWKKKKRPGWKKEGKLM